MVSLAAVTSSANLDFKSASEGSACGGAGALGDGVDVCDDGFGGPFNSVNSLGTVASHGLTKAALAAILNLDWRPLFPVLSAVALFDI